MKWADLKSLAERRDSLWIIVIALASGVAVLGIALALVALRPRPHVLVPAASTPVVLTPETVPDSSATAFALVYVMTFDNYTPATVETAATALKARVAPRRWSEVADDLDRRTRVILEGRMSAHTIPKPGSLVTRPATGTVRVRIPATRRLYIADRLSRESDVDYEIDLEPGVPTIANPYGLWVVGQRMEEPHENRR